MDPRQKPTGFVARCRCGVFVAALDIERMDRNLAAKELGLWLMRGDTVEPRFGGTWSERIESCRCTKAAA